LHVLAKGAATALMYIANPLFLKIYIAVDYALYFVYLTYRKDIVFYIAMPPTASWISSFIYRIMLKIVGDFSGTPINKLPLFLGGSYYIFNLISAQASVLVSVHIYNLEMVDIDDKEKIADDKLWSMALALVGLWCFIMVYFLLRVVTPTHRHTFWSPVSGRQCCQEYYTKGETDEDKMGIFGTNKLLWESDLGSELMEFTQQNWSRWEKDKPSWFTEKIKAEVPNNYIPKESLVGLGGANRMRRGSAAGSVRESFKIIEAQGSVEKEEAVVEEVVEKIFYEEEV
jgi:hypothetical protein